MLSSAIEDSFNENPATTASRPLTPSQKYRPLGPSKAARWMSILRQAMCLPKTLLTIHRIIREDLAPAALDENLWAFWGFHQEVFDNQPCDPHYCARTWQKAQLSAIGPQHVIRGLAVWELAFMMNFAMESEEPIMDYTQQSGEGFRFLLPALGRFMGKNEEQAKYSAEHRLPWCESAWCAEERRHSNAFARMIERLVNVSPSRENPNQPMEVTADEHDAIFHIINRQTSEWNASSSYIVMAAHAAGDLHILIRNIVRDEIKHLSILGCAYMYLFGPRFWKRLLDCVKLGITNYRQRRNRSGGDLLGSNPILAIEGIAAHLLTAQYLTKWLKTVPLSALTTVFETPSKLPDLAAFAPSPERQAEIDKTLRNGQQKRVGLDRWSPTARDFALTQRRFEEGNAETIADIIAWELDNFQGAELPGSAAERRIRRRIAKVKLRSCRENEMIRRCLLDSLRHYQIQNNRHVLSRHFLSVRSGYGVADKAGIPMTAHGSSLTT